MSSKFIPNSDSLSFNPNLSLAFLGYLKKGLISSAAVIPYLDNNRA